MKLKRELVIKYLKDFDFESLFIEVIQWEPSESATIYIEVDGELFTLEPIIEKNNITVIKCIVENIPSKTVISSIESQLTSTHLLIIADASKTEQVWIWKDPIKKKSQPKLHYYDVNQSAEPLIQKLEPLFSSFDEISTHISKVSDINKGFNVEQVTKQFFQDFEGLHQNFCLEIEGIDNEADRRWYASVLLNRLMFVYFLQRRYFLDQGNNEYLQNKLKICQTNNESFYDFLKHLFFEGFAKPEYERSNEIQQQLGKICYLNGGLFLRHSIEQKYSQIKVNDRAFENVFKLFSGYSWHLNDRPDTEKDKYEVNPDVLGYIFEKYINQKEFGAYYTRPEITEYLCDRTINKLVLDRSNELGHSFVNLQEVITHLDGELCDHLLNKILPTLTLLDPACGSGAFLVAAMKTLIDIYQQVTAKAKTFSDLPKIANWLAEAEAHPSLEYYIKKRIITDNLYGVDIMEEATEIAKLRLFLALVASAKTVEDLEPLPNIDFNIMAGNSLIGLIRVDGNAFDSLSGNQKSKTGIDPTQINLLQTTAIQGNLLNALAASEYEKILDDKNKSIELYKKHAFQRQDENLPQEIRLLQLRDHIDKLNRESQGKLNQLLLAEFSTKLGIKYEEAQLEGKPQKRLLTMADIDALEPFHWGYHFDKVFEKGGFDAIIANPPWETFQPNAKEFFINHSDLVSKKKMDIKDFEKALIELTKDNKIKSKWLDYQSKFAYQRQYFRFAEDYKNQVPIISGKRHGKDVNLYKLFLERCFHLLRYGGECGIVIPSGIYTDLGTKQLREMLFSETEVTGLFCFENRKEIFEKVHRSFKFVVLSFEKGKNTQIFPARFMRHDVKELLDFPKSEDIKLNVNLIRRLSPDSLSIMEFKSAIDVTIAEKMICFSLLGERIEDKWNLELHREFNMTDDAYLFRKKTSSEMLPLYEGKMIHQFTHQYAEPRYWVNEQEGRNAILGKRETDRGQILEYQNYRLGFRSTGENTNVRNLISTILIKNCFCGNSLNLSKGFHLKNSILLFLSGMFNSFILDYVIRLKISRNINMFYVYQLPIPRLQKGDQWFSEIVERAAKLICTTPEFDELAAEVGLGSHQNGVTDEAERARLRAELDGIIAHLYGLTETEFIHILSTFPIVADPIKQNALNAYCDVRTGLIKSRC
jgi:hypothetical protein